VSFDLCVFYTTKYITDDEARLRYKNFCGQKNLTPYIEPHPSVSAFLKELTEAYPQIDDYDEDSEEYDDCPWSCSFDVSEWHIIMPTSSSCDNDVFDLIIALAKKHRLVLFDPQSSRIEVALFLPALLYKKIKKVLRGFMYIFR
jgi:hypothetical protein